MDNISLLHTKVANMIYVGGSVYTENKIQRALDLLLLPLFIMVDLPRHLHLYTYILTTFSST